jgi:hypothetical protein
MALETSEAQAAVAPMLVGNRLSLAELRKLFHTRKRFAARATVKTDCA